MEDIEFKDVHADLVTSVGDLAIKRVQDIDDRYLDRLREEKFLSSAVAGNYHKVAAVPVAVIERWRRHGFDAMREPIQDVIKRLQAEGLDVFITTTKRV